MLVSFDLETAGEFVGIVQISAEICRVEVKPTGKSYTKDKKGAVSRGDLTFNEYVNPKSDMDWDPQTVRTHGLNPADPRIVSADEIDVVWERFVSWIKANIAEDETGILVAWNGKASDLKWLWKLTQAPGTHLLMPCQIEFFIDPSNTVSGRSWAAPRVRSPSAGCVGRRVMIVMHEIVHFIVICH